MSDPTIRSRTISALVTLGVIILAALLWLAYAAVTRPLASTADTAELVALDTQLTRIQAGIRPIADAFTSQSASEPIDVTAYRAKVAALRTLVDSTNDLAATSPDTLELRDLVLTGGSQIVNGMDQALDALTSDDATATQPAASRIEEGLGNLQDARTTLDRLLGRNQPV
jgi:HAMP domain-containing protein